MPEAMLDFGPCLMSCFGQWDINRCDMSKDLKAILKSSASDLKNFQVWNITLMQKKHTKQKSIAQWFITKQTAV